MKKDSILYISAGAVMANTLAFALTFDSATYQKDYHLSYSSVTSKEHAFSQRIIFGMFFALAGQSLMDNLGKFILKRQFADTLPAQLLLQLTMLIPSISYLFGTPNINYAAFYWTLLHLQIIVIVHVAFCFWIHRMSSNRLILVEVYGNSLIMVITFSMHIYLTHPSWIISSATASTAWVFLLIYRIVFGLNCIAISGMIVRSVLYYFQAKKQPSTVEERWAITAAGAVFVYYLGFLSIQCSFPETNYAQNLSTGYIVANNYWLAMFSFIMNSIIERKDRREGIMAELQLEIKRLFVRYVSHEIRTPLNTTLLGLNLIEKEINYSQNERTNNSYVTEMITDATNSCNIAIDILSDLLLYEKIDGGLLTLKKEELAVWPFLQGVLRVFLIQAKSANVELSWPSLCIPGVYCDIDKYKFSQVMRNLVSNALKFTPEGGRVRITASVITTLEPPSARQYSLKSYSDCVLLDEPKGINRDIPPIARISSPNDRVDRDGVIGIAAATNFFEDEEISAKTQNSNASLELFRRRYPEEGSPNGRYKRNLRQSEKLNGNVIVHGGHSAHVNHSTLPGTPKYDMPEIVLDDDDQSSPSLLLTNNDSDNHLPESPNRCHDDAGSIGIENTRKSFARDAFEAVGAHIIKILSTDTNDTNNRSRHRVFPKTSWVRITVTDSGAGISKDNQERLFKEIVQFDADKLQKGQGSGIGLWISNSIVKLHNGKIGVVSEGEGAGSTFYVDIPVTRCVAGHDLHQISLSRDDVSSSNRYSTSPSYRTNENQAFSSRLNSPNARSHRIAQGSPVGREQKRSIQASTTTNKQVATSFRPTRQSVIEVAYVDETEQHSGKHTFNIHSESETVLVATAEGKTKDSAIRKSVSRSSISTDAGRGYEPSRSGSFVASSSSSTRDLNIASRGFSSSISGSFSLPQDSSASYGYHQDVQNTRNKLFPNMLPISVDIPMPRKFVPNKRDSIQERSIEDSELNDGAYIEVQDLEVDDYDDRVGSFDDSIDTELQEIDQSFRSKPSEKSHPIEDGGAFVAVCSSLSERFDSSAALSHTLIENDRKERIYSKRVLIVDDSSMNRKFVNRLLRHKILHREEAANGKEAVEKCITSMKCGESFDLLLVDYNMPIMDGPTAVRMLRDIGFAGGIIGITGDADEKSIEYFSHSGVDKVLIKPLNADVFQETITDVMLGPIGND